MYNPPCLLLLRGSSWVKKLPPTVGTCVSIHNHCLWVPRGKMWVNFAGLQKRWSLMPGWSWPGAQTRFVKKLLDVTGVANRCPFHPSLISRFISSSSDKYSFVSYFKPTVFFWRSYIMICGHFILSLMDEIDWFPKTLTHIKICNWGTKTNITINSPEIQKLSSLSSVGGYGSRNHTMASLVPPATAHRPHGHHPNNLRGRCRLPQEGSSIPGNGPGPWAVNTERLQR